MAEDLLLSLRITADGKLAAAELRGVAQSVDQVGAAAGKSAKELLGTGSAAERLRASAQGVRASLNEAASAADRLRGSTNAAGTAANQATRAAQQLGGQLRLTQQQTLQLGQQMQDFTLQVAGGGNALLALAQQGSQASFIMGGFGNLLRTLTTPLNLAIAGVAALGLGLVAVAANAEMNARTLNTVQTSLAATGRSAELSRADIQRLIDTTAQLAGVSRSAAEQSVNSFARTRRIGGELMGQLTKEVGNYARFIGKDVPEAAEDMAKSFADPTEGAKRLQEQTGKLSGEQLKLIQTLDATGDLLGAQKVLFGELAPQIRDMARGSMTELEKKLDDVAKAGDRVKQALTSAGAVDLRELQEKVDRLRQGATPATPDANGVTPALPGGTFGAASRAAARGRSGGGSLREAELQLFDAQSAATERAYDRIRTNYLGLGQTAEDVLKLGRGAAKRFDASGERQEQLGIVGTQLSNAYAAAVDRGDTKSAGEIQGALERLTAGYLPSTRTASQQAQVDLDRERQIAGYGPTQQAAQRAYLEAKDSALRTGIYGEADAEAQGRAARDRVLVQQGSAASLQLLPLDVQARGLGGVAEAYRTGGLFAGGQARIALAADAQAATTPGFNRAGFIEKETAKQAGEFGVQAEQRLKQLTLETEATERLATARGKSNLAAEDAQRVNQVEMLKAQAEAAGKSAAEIENLGNRFDVLLKRQQAANREAANQAALQSKRDELELLGKELDLVGATDQLRGQALERLREEQRLRRDGLSLTSEEGKAQLALSDEIGKTRGKLEEANRARELWLEPFKNAIQGIQSAFSDLFVSIFSGGVRSFRDLAGSIKQVFIRLAAEIAALLIFKPVVGGLLNGVGLGGLAQQLGGGGGGGGNPLSLLNFSGGQNWFGAPTLSDLSMTSWGSGVADFFSGGSFFSNTAAGAGIALPADITNSIGGSIALANAGSFGAGAMDAAAAGGFAIDSASGVAGMASSGAGAGMGFGSMAMGGLSVLGGGLTLFNAVKNGQGGISGGLQGAMGGAMMGVPFGPIGMGVGAVVGGLLGGLTGKKKSVGPGGSGAVLVGPGGAYGQATSGDNGYDGGATTGIAQQAASALNRIAAAAGATVTDRAIAGWQEQGGRLMYGFNGEGYGLDPGEDPIGTYIRAALGRGALEGGDQRVIGEFMSGKSIEQVSATFAALREEAQALAAGLRQAAEDLKLSDLSPYKNAQKVSLAKELLDKDVERAAGGDREAMTRLASDIAGWLQFSLRENDRASDAYIADFNTGQAILNRFANQADQEAADLPKFALGGRPPARGAYLVGEHGPEVRVDDGPGTIYPNDVLGDFAEMSRQQQRGNDVLQGVRADLRMFGDRTLMAMAMARSARRRTAA